MTLTCAKCHSTKIALNVQVMDQGQYSDGSLKAIVVEKPEAIIFQGRKTTRIRANICGECGFTELFADAPELIYASYLKSQEPRP
jgi:hypothetical protein